jgi:chemotaxis regulatin CheY-phosphate phosphatase CheZ
MSMSQEEIEALMNESASFAPSEETTDVAEDDSNNNDELSQDDIAALVADVQPDKNSTEEVIATKEDEVIQEIPEENIDMQEQQDLASLVEDVVVDENSAGDTKSEESIDDILAGIDGITDDEPSASTPDVAVEQTLNQKIDQGVYPLPVEKEHKVVNQLHEVAEDSEEKASQIFDVLSFVLDENAEIEKSTKKINEFFDKQQELLEALNKKFPKIAIFDENLKLVEDVRSNTSDINNKLNDINNQIFNAMDLMQFHDINRQKIERVMAVIKKLSTYLNGLFEDDSDKPEIQIARHISGDSNDTVDADDLEDLIASFNKE